MTDVVAGRFALCDPIASGGSGVVWRAWDRRTGRMCAAKVLRRRDAGELLRFAREQSVRLNHPAVLTPYSWAAEDDHVVIATELMDGGSLSTLLGDYGALDEPTVVSVLEQLLDALASVHAAGLVHRDVKPANLLMHATGRGPLRLRLSDFGIAVREDDARLTRHGHVVGTPGYLPPEALGGARPDPRQDLFAAGQLALALLLGSESDEPRAVPAVQDAVLRRVLTALTCIDPADRPASATAARAALQGARRAALPHTADAEPVDVLDQLPPVETVETVATAELEHRAPAATATLAGTPRRLRRRWGRAAALTGGVASALGVSLALTLGGDGNGTPPAPGTPRSSPSTPPSRTGSTTPATGAGCDWQQQGDRRRTSAGAVLVCTLRGGRYLWLPAS